MKRIIIIMLLVVATAHPAFAVSLAYQYKFADINKYGIGIHAVDINWYNYDLAVSLYMSDRVSGNRIFDGVKIHNLMRRQPKLDLSEYTSALHYINNSLIRAAEPVPNKPHVLVSHNGESYAVNWKKGLTSKVSKIHNFRSNILTQEPIPGTGNCPPANLNQFDLSGNLLATYGNASNLATKDVIPGTTILYGVTSCKQYSVYDMARQQVLWTSAPDTGILHPNGHAYILSPAGQLIAPYYGKLRLINMADGNFIKELPDITDVTGNKIYAYSTGSPMSLVANDIITYVTDNITYYIARIDATTMKIKWKTAVGKGTGAYQHMKSILVRDLVISAIGNQVVVARLSDGSLLFNQTNVTDAMYESAIKVSPDGKRLFTHTMESAYIFNLYD